MGGVLSLPSLRIVLAVSGRSQTSTGRHVSCKANDKLEPLQNHPACSSPPSSWCCMAFQLASPTQTIGEAADRREFPMIICARSEKVSRTQDINNALYGNWITAIDVTAFDSSFPNGATLHTSLLDHSRRDARPVSLVLLGGQGRAGPHPVVLSRTDTKSRPPHHHSHSGKESPQLCPCTPF